MKKIIETVAEGGGELGVHMYPYFCMIGGKMAPGIFCLFWKFSITNTSRYSTCKL
jgi:hypothetical protein